jgi:alkaline phosphatase
MLQYATGDHTAGFVPLFAIGPAAERFGGLKENREIGQLLQELLRPTQ